MAPRRKAVASCQALSLRTLEKATGNYIKQASEDLVLAENLLESSIKKVQIYLFHSTPRCLCSQVATSFINALTSWLKVCSNQSSCMTTSKDNKGGQTGSSEFNDSMYIGKGNVTIIEMALRSIEMALMSIAKLQGIPGQIGQN